MRKFTLQICLLFSFLFVTSFNDVSAIDKEMLNKSLENNFETNYSKSKIYIKTNTNKYFIKDKLQSSGIKNVKNITQPFNKYVKKNIKLQSSNRLSNIYLIEFNSNEDVKEICLKLNEQNDIEYATPIFYRELCEYIPNDYDSTNQSYLKQINAFEALEVSKGDTNIIVGVVDSGIDVEHEDLKDNLFINYNEIPNDKIDNDNNGYVDDYQGWDFVGDLDAQDIANEAFAEDNNVYPSAHTSTHSTHVSGLISAVTDNELGIASMGYKVKLLPVKCTVDDLTVSRGVYKTNESLLYAFEMGVDIINCSWGSNSYYDPVEHNIIKTLYENNVLVVVAAGNSGTDLTEFQYPADYPEVLTVGAIDEDGERAYFTNYGPNVDVYAPGVDIYSTDDLNTYKEKDGTSMATPIVSGMAALLKSAMPDLTAEELQYQIKATSQKSTYNDDVIINAENALKYNNPDYPDFKTPGMKVKEIILNEGDTVITQNNNSISAKYTNLFDEVNGLNYSVKSDKFNFEIEGVTSKNLNEHGITEDFQITDDFPYFQGIADIKIDLKKNINDNFDYFDQTELRYPYQFKTNNKFIELAELETYYNVWLYYNYTDSEIFWGASLKNYAMYFYYVGDTFLELNHNTYPQIVSMANDDVLYYTGYQLGVMQNKILYKIEHKQNKIELSKIEENLISDAADFKMIDENTGLIIYQNHDEGKIQAQKVINEELIEIDNLPDHYISSNIVDAKIVTYNNRVGFYVEESEGLSFIYSDDNMNSWHKKSIGDLSNFVFIAYNDSICIACNNRYFGKYYISTDHGFTFEPFEVPYSGSLTGIYSPDNSDEFIFVFSDNVIKSTTDLGETWTNILNYDKTSTKVYGDAKFSTAKTFGNKVRVFNLYDDIEYLEYDLKPKTPEYSYELQSEETINMDTVLINNSKSSYIMLKNTGNALLTVEDIYFTNSYNSAYSFRDDKINFISAGKSKSMYFDLSPKYIGGYDTDIIIKFKEPVDDIIISVKAYADEESSVNELSKDVKIYPNPVKDHIEIVNNSDKLIQKVVISDINGKNVYSGKDIRINLNNLPKGMYFITVQFENEVLNKKFILE